MSPFSAPVLAGAALVTSPAWWRVVEGTGSLSVAATRFLVAVVVCWLALEVVAAMVGPVRRPAASAGEGATAAEPWSGQPVGALDDTVVMPPVTTPGTGDGSAAS